MVTPRLSIACLTRLLLACLFLHGSTSAAQTISYRFEETSSRAYELASLLDGRGVFERLKLFSDSNLNLKTGIRFVLYDGDGTFFDSERNEVLIPYAMLLELHDGVLAKYPQQPEITRKIFSAAVEQMLWFEFGRVLVSQYSLPIRGLEQYALDSFATLMLLNLSDLQSQFILDAAELYLVVDDAKILLQDSAFADEHAFDQHRYRRIVCLVLGRDDDSDVDLLAELAWDKERLELCRKQYMRSLTDWSEALAPYLKPDSKLQRWTR